MKIAVFSSSFRAGGAERVCVSLVTKWVAGGHEVTVFCLNLHDAVFDHELPTEAPLHNFNVPHLRWAVVKIWRVLRRGGFDCYFCFNHQLALALLLARKLVRGRRPVIARNINTFSSSRNQRHGLWHKQVTYGLVKVLYRQCERIVAQSNEMKADLVSNYGCLPGQVAILPNPVNPAVSRWKEQAAPVLFSEKGSRVLFVGSLRQVKDPLFLLRGFALFARRDGNALLIIAGNGPMRTEMEREGKRLGIDDKVRFEGFTPEIGRLYRAANVTVLTSHSEGCPNALIESMSVGTPVVALDCPTGPRELIKDGVNGFLVAQRDPEQFAAALERVVSRSWDRAAVAATVAQHDCRSVAEAYLRTMQEAIDCAC